MNKYEEYINHLEDKRNILEIRLDKKSEEKYNLINDNYDIETRVDTLTEQIEELEEIEKILIKYGNQDTIDKEEKKYIIQNFTCLGIGALFGSIAGIATNPSGRVIDKIIKGLIITFGVPVIAIGIRNIINHSGKRAYYKRVVKENNLEDIQFKLNRKKKKKKKLEETYERNNIKIVILNEKMEILCNALKEFNNLKYKVERLSSEALDYAKEVHGYYIHSKHPKYYENTINQHFKGDEKIKDIMKRERKLENDN